MIQRKQSLFLLVAMLLIIFVLFVPFIQTEYVKFDSFSITNLKIEDAKSISLYPIGVFIILISSLHLLTLFLFKNRRLQMRFTIFCLLLSVGFYGLLLFYHFQLKDEYGIDFFMYNYSLVTPLLAAVFDFLAFKGIQKDELLIRASNRLR